MLNVLTPIDLQATIVRNPPMVAPDASVSEAIAVMGETGASCVLVVEDGHVLAVFTERDPIRLILQSTPLDQLLVQAVISQPVITLNESDFTEIGVALNLFRQHQIRHLPVVDDADRLVGLLSQDSLTEVLAQSVTQPGIQPGIRPSVVAALPIDPKRGLSEALNEELHITLEELRVAEEALKEQNLQLERERQNYQDLFEFAPDGYLVTDPAGVIQAANRAIAAQLQVSPGFLLGKPLVLFIAPVDHALFYVHLNQLPSHHPIHTWDCTIQPRQGDPFPAQLTVGTIHNDSDSIIVGLRWLIHDISEAKRAEAIRNQMEVALRQQEAQSRAVLTAIPDLMFRVGTDGRYRGYLTSHTMFDVIPQTVDLVGRSLDEMLPPDLAQRQYHHLQQALQTGEVQIYEQQIQVDDRLQDEEVRVVPCGDDEVLFMIRDISDRKAAEAKLRQYERVMSAVTDGMSLIDRNHHCQWVNQIYQGWHQKPLEEIIGRPISELLGETKYLTEIQDRLDRALAGEVQLYETWCDYPDGNRRFLRVAYAPYIELDGTITGAVINLHDLTALKQTEIALQENEQFLRSIYEGVEQAIFTIDVLETGEFRYVAFNPAAERIAGKSTAEIFGKVPGEKVYQRYVECVQTGAPITYEECLTFRGQPTWWLTTLNPLRDASSRIYRIVGTSVDITQRKQAEMVRDAQNAILERIANADPLPEILDTLLRAMELQLVDSHCSIMLCENDGTLRHGIAPSLPTAYLQAIEGVPIGDGVGCCGTAALRQEVVIVTDIATDPLWRDYCHLALDHGLCACWSVPIVASNGATLGVFGVYYREIRTPQPQELEQVMQLVHLAGIAIERDQETQVLEALNQSLERRVEERTVALQKSEQRYRALMEGASDAILLADTQGNLVEANPKAEELLGYSRDELMSMHFSQLHPPEVLTATRDHFSGIALRNEGPTFETLVLCKDGKQVPVGITGSRIEIDGEQFAQGIFRDISDRKRTEVALRASEERYRQIVETQTEFVLRSAPDTTITFANTAFCHALGTSLEHVIGLPWNAFVPAEDLTNLIAKVATLSPEQPTFENTNAHFRSDGQIGWTQWVNLGIFNAQGDLIEIQSVGRDITQIRLAENALQESDARFRTAFDTTSVGMSLSSPDGRFLKANAAFCQFLGYSEAELLDLTFQEVTHPDDLAIDLEHYRQLLAGTINHYSIEKRYVSKRKQVLWGLLSLSVVRDGHNQPLYCICQVQDINDRKQAESALRLSETRFRRAFDGAAVGMCLVSTDGQFLKVNAAFCAFLDYDTDELLELRVQDVTHPNDLAAKLDLLEQMLAGTAQSYYLEQRYYTKQGQLVWGSVSISLVRDLKEHPLYFVAQVQDISDRKQLEQQQQRLTAILEASTDYISMCDVQGTIFWKNTALKRMCGITPDNDRRTYQIADCHPQWASVLVQQQGLPTAIATGSWVGETALWDANGQEISVSQLILAHYSLHGEVEFFSFIMRDIRLQKEYEQQLERTNAELLRATRLKDEFLANMSHELRTPLNAILGMSEGLLDEVFGSLTTRQTESIATIERSGKHLLSLITDILDVSKISAGKLELEMSSVAITDLCSSSLMFVKQQAFKKQIQLRTIVPTNLGTITVDERRMRQVLINLLTNAVKFTPTDGQVTLEVHAEPAEINLAERVSTSRPVVPPIRIAADGHLIYEQDYCLCISVSDTGIGIATADQAKLFQPFVQLDSKLNRQYEGTGLGLTLVKQIVELHGGSVSLHSDLGHGSCFTVCIPYQQAVTASTTSVQRGDVFAIAPPAHPSAMSPTNTPAGELATTPLILLAEDNEANISTLSSYLMARNYRMVLARDGREAIDLTQTCQPQLILMDIQMPGVDGLEAIRHIRANPQFDAIPIIALTALAMPSDRQRCLAAGATEYMTKPVKLKALSLMIQSLLAPQI